MRRTFMLGFFIGVLTVVSVAAASNPVIKKADYNEAHINYNDSGYLDLNGKNLISVINEGETNFSNYMPLRDVLENLGFAVSWYQGEISVYSKEYVSSSDRWISLREVNNRLRPEPSVVGRFGYHEETREVYAYFDAKYNWAIPTAAFADGTVFVLKYGVNQLLELFSKPGIDSFNLDYLYDGDMEDLAEYGVVSDLIWAQPDFIDNDREHLNKLRVIMKYTNYEVYYNNVLQGYIDFVYTEDWDSHYMRKSDINEYLKKYSYPLVE